VENTRWEGWGEVCCHVWSSEVGSPRLCRLSPRRVGPEEQALIMYWRIWDLWGPTNIAASMVAELDDTLPYLQGV
jgi:hypothetical protein